jgi:methylmalonyl-CoA mutase
MAQDSFQDLLRQYFPKTNNEKWKQTAITEIDGKNPFVELSWNNADGLTFAPYYAKEDVISLQYLQKFNQLPAKKSFLGNRAWQNMPLVTVADEITANKKSLDHLNNGADGILFRLSEKKSHDACKLLENIELKYCAVSFTGNIDDKFLHSLSECISKLNDDQSLLDGSLFWETLPQNGKSQFLKLKNYRSFGISIKASTPAQEICDALTNGVAIINRLAEVMPAGEAFGKIAFLLPQQSDFLLGIVKIKVLRLLWYQIARAYDLNHVRPDDLKIHAVSDVFRGAQLQPHGNLLQGTIASMASVIGGCDALTVLPEDENNPMMDRIARNVTNILREESNFDKVADPLAGSYTIDAMTDKMAEHVWAKFQSKMKTK